MQEFEEKEKEEKSREKEKDFNKIIVESALLIIANIFGIFFYINKGLNIFKIPAQNWYKIFEFILIVGFFILTFLGPIILAYYLIRFLVTKEKRTGYLKSWLDMKVTIDLIIIIAIFIRLIIQPFNIIGSSMEPNFHDAQYVIANTINYQLSQPKRGDVVVFEYPFDQSKNYIKRVVGLPEERIKIEKGKVTVFNSQYPQGKELQEPYLSYDIKTQSRNKEYSDIVLKDNQFYVLGDNREASSDSREWGPLGKEYIIGKAWLVVWPVSDWKLITLPEYSYSSQAYLSNILKSNLSLEF